MLRGRGHLRVSGSGTKTPEVSGYPVCSVVLALAIAWAGCSHASRGDPCAHRGTLVLVRMHAHRLSLCANGHRSASFPVALGSSGFGKRQRGDDRTPLGAYPLGPPRASKKFGIFIPIGYPTASQRAQGFTGSDVGIHGPLRRAAWLGRLNTWFDITKGCVMVGSDAEIGRIAQFVRARHPRIALE